MLTNKEMAQLKKYLEIISLEDLESLCLPKKADIPGWLPSQISEHLSCHIDAINNMKMNESAFTDPIDLFFDVSMIVACEIRENLLLYAIAREQEMEEGLIFLQRVSNLKEAWKQFVLGYGIREEAIHQLSPPESSYMCLVAGRLPQPNLEAIKHYQFLWRCS